MTLLLRYVSGAPIIENKFKYNEEFQRYRRRTNCMIPFFPIRKQKEPVEPNNEPMNEKKQHPKTGNYA